MSVLALICHGPKKVIQYFAEEETRNFQEIVKKDVSKFFRSAQALQNLRLHHCADHGFELPPREGNYAGTLTWTLTHDLFTPKFHESCQSFSLYTHWHHKRFGTLLWTFAYIFDMYLFFHQTTVWKTGFKNLEQSLYLCILRFWISITASNYQLYTFLIVALCLYLFIHRLWSYEVGNRWG